MNCWPGLPQGAEQSLQNGVSYFIWKGAKDEMHLSPAFETGWVCCGGKRAGGPREKNMQSRLKRNGQRWIKMDKAGSVKLAWLWHSFGLLWQVWQLREAGLEPILDTSACWILHFVSFCQNNLDTFLQLLLESPEFDVRYRHCPIYCSIPKFRDAGRTQWKQP